MEYNDLEEKTGIIITTIIITIILVFTMLIISQIIEMNNGIEKINIKTLGTKMCNEHNLTLKNYTTKDYEPTIYCTKETKQKNIEDGYLIEI